MTNIDQKMEWEKTALEKYNKMIQRIPLFHRQIAQQVVEKKAVRGAMLLLRERVFAEGPDYGPYRSPDTRR
jgi:hypothetical protein